MSGASPWRRYFKAFASVIIILLVLIASLIANLETAHAAGKPPDKVHPAPSDVNLLHGANPGLQRGAQRTTHKVRTADGVIASSTVTGTAPIIMVHGLNQSTSSGMSCTAGLWGNTHSYLQGTHPGLGSDTIHWTGALRMIGFYNGDWDCDAYISTHNNPHGNYSGASSCNGVSTQDGFSVGNSDASVGTNNEPIEHIACVLSWYIWNNYAQYGTNVKIVAHSMGGLIVRYMIERVAALL